MTASLDTLLWRSHNALAGFVRELECTDQDGWAHIAEQWFDALVSAVEAVEEHERIDAEREEASYQRIWGGLL